jgi:hypothetical protein
MRAPICCQATEDQRAVALHSSSRRRASLNKCLVQTHIAAPEDRNQVRTRDWKLTVPGPTQRKKSKKSAPRGSVSLDKRGPHKCWAVALCGSLGSNAEIRRRVLSYKIGRFVDGRTVYSVKVAIGGARCVSPCCRIQATTKASFVNNPSCFRTAALVRTCQA